MKFTHPGHKWLVLPACLVLAASLQAGEPNPPATAPAGEQATRVIGNGPDGYKLAAYLDCGTALEAGGPGGPRLRILDGEPLKWAGAESHGPLGTAAADEREVVCEVNGLRAGAEYVLGFTWWDFEGAGRMQSVRFGSGEPLKWTTVLPAGPAVAWYQDKPSWAQIHLPISEAFRKQGRLLVGFHRDGPGSAVVSEVWLMERQRPAQRQAGAERMQDADAGGRKRVVVITGDDYLGHPWRETAPELAAILRDDPRLEVTVIESPMILASPLMAHYDAAVLHYMNWKGRPDPGEGVRNGLVQYVEFGKGLVLVHFACGAFQSWPGFVKVAGRVWDPKLRGHDPYGTFGVRISDRAHPITAGMSDFQATDEMYTCLVGDAPIRVLAEATSVVDHKVYPMGFVFEGGKGRVFHSPLGHDLKAFKSSGTRELFRRATAWAAGLEPK